MKKFLFILIAIVALVAIDSCFASTLKEGETVYGIESVYETPEKYVLNLQSAKAELEVLKSKQELNLKSGDVVIVTPEGYVHKLWITKGIYICFVFLFGVIVGGVMLYFVAVYNASKKQHDH